VLTLHSVDLPDDLFLEGETKPKRKTSKKEKEKGAAPDAASGATNKRSFNNSGMDVRENPGAETAKHTAMNDSKRVRVKG
jgi:hypothetical protein